MKTFLVLFFALITCAAPAQNHSIDSLKKLLQTEKDDTNKLNKLNEFVHEFRYTEPETAIYFANAALALASRLNYEMGIADAKRMIGALYARQGRCDEGVKACYDALDLYNKLLRSAKTQGKEEIIKKIGLTYCEIGNNRFTQGNNPEALEKFFYALKIKEKTRDSTGIAALEFNIGNVYFYQHNYSEALQHDFASLKITEQIGNKADVSSCYDAIGIAYFDQGSYSEAFKNYAISLRLAEESKDKYAMAEIYTDVGAANAKQKNYGEALKYDFKALKLCEEIDMKWQLPFVCNNIVSVYIKQHKYNDASAYLKKALSIAKETGHSEYIKLSYENLQTLDSTRGNYKKALEDYKLVVAYRDSLINQENTKKMLQRQMQYDFDKKEDSTKAVQDKKEAIAKAEIQNQKTIRNFSYTGAFAVLSFAGVGFYRYKKRRKLQSQQEMLNERLRISRELHDDIGSTLGSISIYSEVAKNRNEKKESSEEVLTKIGHTSRELIDKMSDIVWSLNPNNESFEELQNRMTAFSSMILTPRNIVFEFSANEETKEIKLASGQRKNIFLIFKEAIYNIAKFAGCKKVNILLKVENNIFKMVITDDGQGFDPLSFAEGRGKAYNGNGIKNMRARAEEMGGKFRLVSGMNKGTIVQLDLKV